MFQAVAEREPPKTVLVLGASGSLGSVVAKQFTATNCKILCTGFSKAPLFGETYRFDCRSSQEIGRLKEWVDEKAKRLYAIVNCIGTTADSGLVKQSHEQWKNVLDVNLKSAFQITRALLPKLLKQRSGHFIFIGSWSGLCGRIGQTSYAASKAGLIGFTQSLSREYSSRGIRANCIIPGVFKSPLTDGLTQTQLDVIFRGAALQQFSDLQETGRFIAQLASMEHVTGQVFHLDGRITSTY